MERIAIKLRDGGVTFCCNCNVESCCTEVKKVMRGFNHENNNGIDLISHESGPEILIDLALGVAGGLIIEVSKLIVSLIKARRKDNASNGNNDRKIVMYMRTTKEDRKNDSIEETILELYESDAVDTEVVKKAIEKGLAKRKGK